ncbi:MAG TPA: hypothetical protein VNT81_18530, partial [Vicinamibacterales bacterium]|nr:hypothetical protein [Vicinamibacterales bacterium]
MTAITDRRSLCDAATYASHCVAGGSCDISNFGGNNHKRAKPHLVTVEYLDVNARYGPEDFPTPIEPPSWTPPLRPPASGP